MKLTLSEELKSMGVNNTPKLNCLDSQQEQESDDTQDDTLNSPPDKKKERTLLLTDENYKILCMADSKGYNHSVGAEKLCNMYLALSGPLDFRKYELERAKRKAKELNLF